jgi:hypothetical protein
MLTGTPPRRLRQRRSEVLDVAGHRQIQIRGGPRLGRGAELQRRSTGHQPRLRITVEQTRHELLQREPPCHLHPVTAGAARDLTDPRV